MKRSMLFALALILLFSVVAVADRELIALGPEPYPSGPVSFETYEPEAGVIRPGEVATYEFTWNGIPAAAARLEVRTDPDRPDYICAGAEGSIFGRVASLYEAKDSITSCMDAKTFKPDKYSVRIRETITSYDMLVKFDHDAEVADRQKKSRGDSSDKQFRYVNGFCPVSVFLYIRSLPWRPGDKRRFEVIDGNDRLLLVVEAKETKKITVPAGTFKAIRIVPSLFDMPSDYRKENAAWWEREKKRDEQRLKLISSFEMWMGVDSPRPVLKITSDVFFGHIEMNLVELTVPEDTI